MELVSYNFFNRELQLLPSMMWNNVNLHGKKYIAKNSTVDRSDLKERCLYYNSLSDVRFSVECTIKQAVWYIGPNGLVSGSSEIELTVPKE